MSEWSESVLSETCVILHYLYLRALWAEVFITTLAGHPPRQSRAQHVHTAVLGAQQGVGGSH